MLILGAAFLATIFVLSALSSVEEKRKLAKIPGCPKCGRKLLPVEVIGGGTPVDADWSCPGRRTSDRPWGHLDTLYFVSKPAVAKPVVVGIDDGEFGGLRAIG